MNKTTTYYLTYGEYLMKEALTEFGDFKIGGRILKKFRFADDTAITANTQELQDVVNRDWLTQEGSMAWKSKLTNQ